MPSRLINGLLRRFTGVEISDFGCAFNAYRRTAIEPMLGAIGRQKFTKALVLSSGVTVEEVDVSHAAVELRLALLADPARPARAARRRRLLAAAGAVDRRHARARLHARRGRARRSTASPTGSSNSNFPGPLFAGAGIVLVLGIQGFVLALIGESLGRIQRDVERRPLYTIEEEL